jgi:cation diffusion facilitator CzcD-associated flavoprotein CzcO
MHSVMIFDSNRSIGGAWAKERLYDGLRTNNLHGAFEFSDLPMDTATYGVKSGEHVPGEVIHQYLCDYAARFDLVKLVHLETKVETVGQRGDNSWLIQIQHRDFMGKYQTKMVHTMKLVLATGIASQLARPTLLGEKDFGGDLYHSSEFGSRCNDLKSSRSVAVLGGSKSAWDVAYSYASVGVHVDWIIRESGIGPRWMALPHATPLKLWIEAMILTRFVTWFSPCIWGDGYQWPKKFLHGTRIGRWIVKAFWQSMKADIIAVNRYDKHTETKKLKPWVEPFWIGTMLEASTIRRISSGWYGTG